MIEEKYQGSLTRTGQNLTRIREEKGVTLQQLAKLSGVKATRIKMIEDGQLDFLQSTMFRLCKALNIWIGDVISD